MLRCCEERVINTIERRCWWVREDVLVYMREGILVVWVRLCVVSSMC